MSDLERPIPHSKRLRVDVDRPLAILDTPGSQVYNAILDQAMDQGLPETIEDVSQTPAPMQARLDWSMMSARTRPHINMLPSMTQFTDIPPAQAYPPTQYDLPPTQVDTQFPPTLRTHKLISLRHNRFLILVLILIIMMIFFCLLYQKVFLFIM